MNAELDTLSKTVIVRVPVPTILDPRVVLLTNGIISSLLERAFRAAFTERGIQFDNMSAAVAGNSVSILIVTPEVFGVIEAVEQELARHTLTPFACIWRFDAAEGIWRICLRGLTSAQWEPLDLPALQREIQLTQSWQAEALAVLNKLGAK